MELKKSNKADLEQMVKTNFLIGFIVALTSVFVIFEWTSFVVKTEDKEPELHKEPLKYDFIEVKTRNYKE